MQANTQVVYCEMKERTVVKMWLKCWGSERLLRAERKNCCERLWHWVVFRCTATAVSDRTEENCHSPRLTGTGTMPSEGLRGLPTKLRSGSCGRWSFGVAPAGSWDMYKKLHEMPPRSANSNLEKQNCYSGTVAAALMKELQR